MNFETGDAYELLDGSGKRLGSILISETSDDRYHGILTAAPRFEEFRDIFRRQDEAIEGQMLGIWDSVNREIESLGLTLSTEIGGSFRIFDVHIKEGRLVSFLTSPFRARVQKPRR